MFQAFVNSFAANQEFREWYRCYPEAKLEESDKVILPPSALHKLASKNTTYPMMFEFSNPELAQLAQRLHGGVLEFGAPEGIAYVPKWMMEKLLIESGGLLHVFNVTLPKGKMVVFQPHLHDFTKLSNPRAVLENQLSRFSCLTYGQSVPVTYRNRVYWLDVVKLQSVQGGAGNAPAVSIVETDISVEFEAAKDFQSESLKSNQSAAAAASILDSDAFGSNHQSSHTAPAPVPVTGASSASSPSLKATSTVTPIQTTSAVVAADGSVKIVRPQSSYFDRLGSSGARLNGKPVPTASAAGSSPTSAMPVLAASLPAGTPLGRSSSQSRPSAPAVSPLARSQSENSPASTAASKAAFSFANSGSPQTALGASGPRTVSEVENGFRYVYEVSAAGMRRLLRRENIETSPTALNSKGYSLK